MGKLLSNFRNTILLSLVLAGVMIFAFGRVSPGGFDGLFWQAVLRWTHVLAGILWIGLLYYFNFVQIGIGVWLAIVMFLNVWGVIWPNQKRALGMIVVDDDAKAKAARVAMLASRTNTLLSLPMLTSMAMYQTLFG